MGSKFKSIQTLSNRCFLRFSKKQSIYHVNCFIKPLFTNHQQWRSYYTRLPHQITKPRVPRISNSSSSPSHSFSTLPSNSNSSKVGFLGWYLGKLDSHPVATKSITTSLIYVAADLTSQIIASPSSIDSIRTLRMAAYGLLILGPTQHRWFNFVSRVLPRRDVLTTLKKLFMGQAIFGPFIASVFFSYNAALQGENGGEIVARLKRDLLPTLLKGLMYWPMCDFVTFKFTPVHLQPLVNSSCSYIWTIYLTYMASLEKLSTS